ncbi:hypothetical protein SAMN05216316_2722 [Nitrosovibrio sp. Nv6]|nr:hypothetical protein SAMN05216316_2722 [Nitrosovibrio sp. Nv6]
MTTTQSGCMAAVKQVVLRSCFGIMATALAGCAGPSIYHWGDLESGLHNRYVTQDHGQADVYLLETIRTAEQQKLKVPPGAYADYGFILFKRGDREGAIASFEKEKLLFPESSAFMTKLIERVKQKEAESTKKALPQAAVTPEAQP